MASLNKASSAPIWLGVTRKFLNFTDSTDKIYKPGFLAYQPENLRLLWWYGMNILNKGETQ